MKRMIPSLVASLAVMLLVVPQARAAQGGQASAGQAAAFERLKSLDGEWTGQATHAGDTMPVTVRYHVTADGSAILETLFAGTPHEMVTVYTMDRGRLVLTHYCAGHTQPRMRARDGSGADRITFDFAGGANFDPKKDNYMHDATLAFTDGDHLHAEWTSWDKGKPAGKAVFDVARAK